jgi:hypothetical protein
MSTGPLPTQAPRPLERTANEHATPPPAGAVPAQSRAEAKARAAAQERADAHRAATSPPRPAGLTRPPVAGELAYESTITAPTEWVPYVYTTAEIQTHAARRGVSIAAIVCGAIGVLAGIFVIWGAPLSLAAIVLALVARVVENRAGGLWLIGLASGILGLAMAVLWFIVNTQMVPAYYS